MSPTEIRRRRGSEDDPFHALRQDMRDFGDVMAPGEAEEPILAPAVRAALFEWLAELRAEDELAAAKLKPRSSALLYGPPGCGKTTLAHHLAARLGLPMVAIGAEGIMAKYLGESEGKLDKLFRTLDRSEPCIVFLDEVESIGGHRSRNTGGSADNARSSILTVLLRKIERYDGMIIAATNRQDHLDPALWRRFHLQISVDLPQAEERFAILRRYGMPFAFSDDDIDLLVDATDGASPALLRGVMENMKRAAVLAERLGRQAETAVDVLRRIVVSVAPPPEIEPPPLWADDGPTWRALAGLTWPPVKGDPA